MSGLLYGKLTMTPRERDTLETILRNVAYHNQRPIVAVRSRPLAMLQTHGTLSAGDLVIEGVTFGEQHGKSA